MNEEIQTITRWQDPTIEILYNKLDAQDKIINTQALEIAELREENEKLTNLWLESQNERRNAIEYIKSIKMVNCKLFDYNGFLKEHLISLEELKKKVEEDGTLEGHFVEVNKDKLLKILGDKE